MTITERAVGRDLGNEVARLRADTPGCADVLHFNHAGASLPPRPVLARVVGHLEREARIGGYEAADEAAAALEAVYGSIAALIGADADEIAVVENATRAWDMAFYAIPFSPGDRILTSVAEYASNVIAFLQMARRGVRVEVVPNDEHGQLSTAALANLLDDRVKLVAVSHMPTSGGLVQPAAEIGRLARAVGALYLLDACQTVGQLPIDVAALGCDMLSATGRKYLRGPRGIGFLYVRRAVIELLTPPFLDLRAATWTAPDRYELRADARRFENWERFVAGQLGLGAAVEYARDLGLEAISACIQRQATLLRSRLAAIPRVTVRDLGTVRGGIVTLTVDGVAPTAIQAALRAQAINVSVSTVASTRYDLEARGIPELVRASVHYVTTNDEIEHLAVGVERIIEGVPVSS